MNTVELLAYTLFIAGVIGVIFAFSLRWFMPKDSEKKIVVCSSYARIYKG